MTLYIEKILYCTIFLLCAMIVSGLHFSLQRLGKTQTREQLKKQGLTYFSKLLKSFVSGQEWDALWFSLNFSKLIFYLIFTLYLFSFIAGESSLLKMYEHISPLTSSTKEFILNALLSIFVTLFSDFCMQFLCARNPKFWFKALTFPSSILLTLTLPLTLGFLKFSHLFFPKKTNFSHASNLRVHEKILEWLRESEIDTLLEKNEKKLIYSVVSFKDKIAREVMVPRINVFSIPSDTSISQAAKHFLEEGYSRIPVYKDNVDKIIGVLLYKDVLNLLIANKNQASQLEDKTVEKLVKSVVYTPETKKIASLLQDFRNKQIHLAIVVNEYGGTEGIVTIEDILEELVGEIEDEYDVQQADLFTAHTTGGWIIDAKMNISDLEEDLGLILPSSPEYDTVGGYIFDKAGTIPSAGWKIHLDEFDIEVISSDERSIQKIKITPHGK